MLTSRSSHELSLIISFLNNKSSIYLIKTCRYIKTHGDRYGFLTSLELDYTTDTMAFIRWFSYHQETLRTVKIKGMDNPHMWLPKYVENVIFDHCSVIKRINPQKPIYVTKSLNITDYHRYNNKNTLRINWTQFPNLEKLELYVYDVDLNGLDLKTLKICKINTLTHK